MGRAERPVYNASDTMMNRTPRIDKHADREGLASCDFPTVNGAGEGFHRESKVKDH